MPNNNYLKGYRFQRRVVDYIKNRCGVIQSLVHNKHIYPPTIIISAGSKGINDIAVGFTLVGSELQFWIGIQCKAGYISKKSIQDGIKRATRKGIRLFYATKDSNHKIVFTPDIDSYIKNMYNYLCGRD